MNSLKPLCFAEVIESSLTIWTGQCWRLEDYPSLGSLVCLEYDTIQAYGVISAIQTQAKESGRKPFAYGKTVEELRQEQPHIFQLLASSVTCLPIGYRQNHHIVHEIPPRPAPLHTFVRVCTPTELKDFFKSPNWLIPFLNLASNNPLADELLIALLRMAYEQADLKTDRLKEIIDLFCLLTRADYRRLKTFLQRIELFIH